MTVNRGHVALTEENFATEVRQSSQPTLVHFWAKWCEPCRALAPVMKEIAGQFKGKATVGKVDIDEHPDLAERYAVRAIPSILFFQEGKVVDRVIGVVSGGVAKTYPLRILNWHEVVNDEIRGKPIAVTY